MIKASFVFISEKRRTFSGGGASGKLQAQQKRPDKFELTLSNCNLLLARDGDRDVREGGGERQVGRGRFPEVVAAAASSLVNRNTLFAAVGRRVYLNLKEYKR